MLEALGQHRQHTCRLFGQGGVIVPCGIAEIFDGIRQIHADQLGMVLQQRDALILISAHKVFG